MIFVGAALLMAAGCDSGDGARQTGGTAPLPSSDTGNAETGPGGGGEETANPGGDGTGATPGDGDSGSTSSDFIAEPDVGSTVECDVWTQDCPEGEKCTAWASDGGIAWNATRCVPIADNPGQPGDGCTAEGGGLSGIDDCGEGSMCWNIDPETNQGTCVAFCEGSPEAPTCEDSSTACTITSDGVLILCLPVCDPLLQDCPAELEACYPGVDGEFACYPDYSGETGEYGDPCEYINVCNPGLFCAPAAIVPGCESALCCSSLCDLTDADPNAQCEGQGGGQECIGWYPEGEIPPGAEHIGYCGIPE